MNDAPESEANAKTEKVEVNGVPYLVIVATKHISKLSEIRYDYGDKTAHWRRGIKRKRTTNENSKSSTLPALTGAQAPLFSTYL